MKKYILYIILFFVFINIGTIVYANTEETLNEQQKEFGIQEFIKNSKQYAGEFFEEIDINEILNNAIKGKVDNSNIFKRIFNLLGKELENSIQSIISIIGIIVIHSILKSISDSLENDGISKLIYYVQYIMIVTIIMANFSDIIKMVQDTSTNLVAFMNMLTPLLITLMAYTGSIATSRSYSTNYPIHD